MATELVAQLRLVRPKARYEYAKDQFLMIGKVMREAADEIERLEREKAAWSGIAAQRNRTNALLADERDTERTKRLQAEHERDALVEKLAQFGKALKGSVDDAFAPDVTPEPRVSVPVGCSCQWTDLAWGRVIDSPNPSCPIHGATSGTRP
jgi:hypothetical protein